jgi:haloacetate dehalogenase
MKRITMFEGFKSKTLSGDGADIHLVIGGKGPPLLLLHGYPQTHCCWHLVAPLLADSFTIVAPDLRGYGDSGKPATDAAHEPYSKRRMAADQIQVMNELGFDRFFVAGHDRGGRVAHRLALDHPNEVERLAVLDIAPTLEMYRRTNMRFAMTYFHWFFLVQPFDFPERLLGGDPEYWLRAAFYVRSVAGGAKNTVTTEAFAEYLRCFRDPATIHATCEDYRASATIDLEHDEADLAKRLTCPFLVIVGEKGGLAKCYDIPALWRERAERVLHHGLPAGHFLPEEMPDAVARLLREFFLGA